MDWTSISWALAGGAIIGVASALLMAMNGRVAGISGILGGLVAAVVPGRVAGASPRSELTWRALFIGGLLLGGAVASLLMPARFDASAAPALPLVAAAGLLVGIGTRIGGGCTSGHGVCGISRFSSRSIVATVTFMATGIATTTAIRLLGGLS